MGLLPREFSFNAKYARPVLAWLGALLLILGLAVHARLYTGQRLQEKRLVSVITGKGDLLEDPDGDGLKNWEEDLWRTDRAKPDTDGDGISDGDEVKEGRDPRVPGSGDPAAASGALPAGSDATQNLTEAIIKNGGLQNILTKSGAPQLPDRDAEAVSIGYQKSAEAATKVEESEIIVQDTGDKEAIRKYYNSVAGIIQKNFGTLYRNDLQLLYEILQNPNQYYRFGLFKYYVAAADISERELRALAVPKAVADFHMRQIGLMAKTKLQFEAFRNAAEDPLTAVIAVQDREMTLAELAGLWSVAVPARLAELRVVFGAQDPAKLLFRWQ